MAIHIPLEVCLRNKMQISRHQQFLGVLSEAGFVITPPAKIMDLGCGAGNLVMELIKDKYDAYGCGLAFKDGPNVDLLSSNQNIRIVDPVNYRLPFEDNMFDVVISDQVFEHVQKYESAIQEMHRVLKPNGVCVHFFPPRYKPIEPHVQVPFATIIQSYWWLRLWAGIGVRTASQHDINAHAVAKRNYDYLTTKTNYLTKKIIHKEFSRFFNKVEFAEQYFLKFSRKGRFTYKISTIFPFISNFYSAFGGRVVVASKPCLP